MRVQCYKCRYAWDYGGKATKFICCPSCRFALSIKKMKRLEGGDSVGIGTDGKESS